MPYKYAGSLIRAGKSWTDSDGIKHPPNWMQWSDEEKAKAGLVWENDPKPFDSKFWQDADTPHKIDDTNQVDADGKAITDKNGKQLVTFGLKSIWKDSKILIFIWTRTRLYVSIWACLVPTRYHPTVAGEEL